MGQHIGIIYASVDGQTKKISEKLNVIFKEKQLETRLYAIDDTNIDLANFHTLIIGASIRYGNHNKLVYEFIEKNKDALKKIKTAFFTVNLVARKKDKNSVETNPYLIKFLEKSNWKPDYLEVFAGKLNYKSYSFIDRVMIKLIMKITDGPTNSNTNIEYTDWEKLDNFGLRISEDYQRSIHNI